MENNHPKSLVGTGEFIKRASFVTFQSTLWLYCVVFFASKKNL